MTVLEKICNITLAQFFSFDNEPADLTEEQRLVLDNWCKLNPEQQQIILDLLISM